FRHFMRTLDGSARFPDVRLVRLGQEPATSEDFAAFCAHFPEACMLLHTLGSTETLTIAHCRMIRHDRIAAGRLPVGAPFDDVEILLLDEQGREVPAGHTGEIVVRSRELASGYWGDAPVDERGFVA